MHYHQFPCNKTTQTKIPHKQIFHLSNWILHHVTKSAIIPLTPKCPY